MQIICTPLWYLEWRAGPPEPEARHVGHVARLGGAGGAGVDDASLGQLVLQLQHRQARLGRLARAHRAQVLGAVTLVKHDLASVKVNCIDHLGTHYIIIGNMTRWEHKIQI